MFLDNRVGKLLELLDVFEGEDLRLVALSVIDSADFAVVRLATSREAPARKLLREHKQLPFSESKILALAVELCLEKQRTLANLCKTLLTAEVNIYYAYPLMVRPHGAPTIAMHIDDELRAGQILCRHHFTLLGESRPDRPVPLRRSVRHAVELSGESQRSEDPPRHGRQAPLAERSRSMAETRRGGEGGCRVTGHEVEVSDSAIGRIGRIRPIRLIYKTPARGNSTRAIRGRQECLSHETAPATSVGRRRLEALDDVVAPHPVAHAAPADVAARGG